MKGHKTGLTLIIIVILIVTGAVVVFGNFFGITNENERGGLFSGGDACVGDFETLYSKNKADLSSCSVLIRNAVAPEAVTSKENNVVIVFDSSGSMEGKTDGTKKIDAAKSALADFAKSLQGSSVNVSMVVYGHKGDNSDTSKALSCKGIDIVYPFGKADVAKMTTALDSFSPKGWTPVEDALKKAYELLMPYNSEKYNNSVLLISDGIETCGGNPVAYVKSMKENGMNVTANVIGFDVDEEAAAQLRNIAGGTGGEYFDVRSRAELDRALSKHAEYMAKFDAKMKQVSQNLEDINTLTEKHFACVEALETERAHMLLDIYADKKVSASCAEKVDDMYTKKYDEANQTLWNSFNATIEEFKAKSR